MENRKFLNKIMILLSLQMAILLATSGCHASQWVLFHDKEIKGYVVEAGTNKPIEGVIVVGMWRLSQIGSQGFGGYAKVIEVKTDKEGKFFIPSWIIFKPWTANSVLHELAPEIVIYKPSYRLYSSHRIMREGFPDDMSKTEEEKKKLKEEYSLNPAKLRRIFTDKERLENYEELGTFARFPDEHFSKEQAKEIFDAIEEEITQLSDSNREKKDILDGIRSLRKSWVGDKK